MEIRETTGTLEGQTIFEQGIVPREMLNKRERKNRKILVNDKNPVVTALLPRRMPVREKDTVYLLCLSGGANSMAMAIRALASSLPIDEIVHCDTGMLYPVIERAIGRFEKRYEVEVTKLGSPIHYWDVVGDQGHATFEHRFCRDILVSLPFEQYKSRKYPGKKIVEYHGLPFDEYKRIRRYRNDNVYFPLIHYFKMDSKQVYQFLKMHGFDELANLRTHIRGRHECWCCPLQYAEDLRYLYLYEPNLWEELVHMDTRARLGVRKQARNKTFRREMELHKYGVALGKKSFHFARDTDPPHHKPFPWAVAIPTDFLKSYNSQHQELPEIYPKELL